MSLSARIAAWRDRLLASPGFQRRAAAFPLTRPLARRSAAELFDICAGFVYTQVLYACVQLDVFEALSGGRRELDDLAKRMAMPRDSARRLLDAAVSLRLVSRHGAECYGLGRLGAALLGNPGVSAMVRHHRMLYEDLRDPVGLLRDPATPTELGRYWSYARAASPGAAGDSSVAEYSELMSASQPFVATEVLGTYSFRSHRRLLDVGGGQGTFLAAVAERWPHLELALFDLPAVAGRASERLEAAGLEVSVTGGDFLRDPLPRGADVISLVRIVHDHDDDVAARILAAAAAALDPGGRLLVAEPMAGTGGGAERVGEAYFGFYLLAMGSGRARTPAELRRLLETAGFREIRLLRTDVPLLTRVMVAEKA